VTRTSRRRDGRRLPVVIAAVSTLILTGCADESASGGAGGGAASGGSAVAAEGDLQVALDYVGAPEGGAADSAAEPVRVGWVNAEEAGPAVFPEATVAAQAAVEFVNEELGGIDGRPLELVTCVIAGSEEQGQACGQQFANDPEVDTVVGGTLIMGSGSMFNALGGAKPFIGSLAITPQEFTATDASFLYGDTTSAYGALATYADEVLKAKSAAVVFPQIPGSDAAAATVEANMKKLGMDVKVVGYPGETTDLVGPLTAAGAQDADVIVPLTESAGCIKAYRALEQLAIQTPVITSNLCSNPNVAEALGDIPQWSFAVIYNTFDTADPQVAMFQEALATYAGPDALTAGSASIGFGQVMTLTKILNGVGADDIDPDTIRQAVRDFGGPAYLGPQQLDCGFDPASPSLCATETFVITYEGNDTWDDHDRTFATPS
jgi:branched-chain amino acid transport system substrate-binding protein